MARSRGPKLTWQCAICEESFGSKGKLSNHAVNHDDASFLTPHCTACERNFDSIHALEIHYIQESHGPPDFACENCKQTFFSQRNLDNHFKSHDECAEVSKGGEVDMAIYCDRCQKTFTTQKQFSNHRSNMNDKCADFRHPTPKKKSPSPATNGYVDLDKPKDDFLTIPDYGDERETEVSNTTTITSTDKIHCRDCKKNFHSMGHFNNHSLGCTPVASSSKAQAATSEPRATLRDSKAIHKNSHPLVVNYTNPQGPNLSVAAAMQTVTLNTLPPVRQVQQLPEPTFPQAPPTHNSSVAPGPVINGTTVFVCGINGCVRICKSEPGLRQHKIDSHGVGGQKLDITGSESWMLNARERDRLRQEGLLRQPSRSSRGRGGGNFPQPPPAAARPPLPATRPQPAKGRPSVPSQHIQHQQSMPTHMLSTMIPAGADTSGAAEMDEAKSIQAKILRLLIQADIFIGHEGNVTVCDLKWTRIHVFKQPEVIATFERMCHLPKMLQGEYLPAPKAFMDDYTIQYPSTEFESAPACDTEKAGLRIVVLSCSKIVLADGRQEVVKIAAVDVLSSCILMNHLVCTDPHTEAGNWRSTVTGIFGWKDVEAARKAGYRVFKGWTAARAALWKFIDSDTIVLGHNLRSDLDALRMIHGRAIDVVKVVEKAARGPLNKVQLSLDSLCRDYSAITLKNDPQYGRDIIMNAFAIREVGLWMIKNEQKFERDARQKSLDYQRVMPSTVGTT